MKWSVYCVALTQQHITSCVCADIFLSSVVLTQCHFFITPPRLFFLQLNVNWCFLCPSSLSLSFEKCVYLRAPRAPRNLCGDSTRLFSDKNPSVSEKINKQPWFLDTNISGRESFCIWEVSVLKVSEEFSRLLVSFCLWGFSEPGRKLQIKMKYFSW